ncbi:oxygen-binding di-iron domain-containing protein [Klebsiella quasipneumoniae]|uniref:MBL fold metallo-hydrolase n=1 Tax=Klebsiella quasipneumoniae TaxID=1463165 RepID=UPI003890DE3F
MTEIIKDLYQFTEVMEPIKLSMHQYLLMTNEPVLIQTGAVSQAQTTIPKLQELLGERKIKYILISHFESDECGGLALVLKEHPEAVAVCSETTARQLMGFGITNNVLIKKPNEIFAGDDFEFQTISSHLKCICGKDFYFLKRNVVFSLAATSCSAWVRITDKLSKAVGTQR